MEDQTLSPPGFSKILWTKTFWALIFAALLYFSPPLFFGKTFFFRDLHLHFLPQRRLLVNFIQAAELPLWDPYLNGGQPLLANPHNLVLYPSSLLYFVLSFFAAFNLEIVFHILACVLACYVLARFLGISATSSCVAGVAYGFCGCTLSFVNVLNRLFAMPYIPILILLWHLFLLEGKKKWFALAAVAGLFQLLTGSPEIPPMTYLTLIGWTFFYPYPKINLLQRARAFILLLVFVLGFAAVQIVPTLEMIANSERGAGMPYETFAAWSLNPRRIPEIIFPQFLGETAMITRSDYWGSEIEDDEFPYLLSIYFGLSLIVLAICGGLGSSPSSYLLLKTRRFLLVLLGISLLLSLGRFLPLFEFLFRYIPFVGVARYPIKFLAGAVLPLSILAGIGCDLLFGAQRKWPSSAKRTGFFWLILILLIVWIAVFSFQPDFANNFVRFWFKRSSLLASQKLLNSFVHATAIWLLFTLIYQYHRIRMHRDHCWLILLVVAMDLMVAGKSLNPYARREFFSVVPDGVGVVKKEAGEGRLYRTKNPSQLLLKTPSNDVIWENRWDLETLNSYLGTYYDIPVIFHKDKDGLANILIMRMRSLVESSPWNEKVALLSSAGVSAVLTSEPLSIPRLRPVARFQSQSNVAFHLYRLDPFLPEIAFLTSWEVSKSDIDTLNRIRKPEFDPFQKAFVSKAVPMPESKDCAKPTLTKLESRMNSKAFDVASACNGMVVLSTPYYPGWKAQVDGKPVQVLRANYAFSAILVPAGKHRIDTIYRPGSLFVGLMISLAFAFLICVLPRSAILPMQTMAKSRVN